MSAPELPLVAYLNITRRVVPYVHNYQTIIVFLKITPHIRVVCPCPRARAAGARPARARAYPGMHTAMHIPCVRTHTATTAGAWTHADKRRSRRWPTSNHTPVPRVRTRTANAARGRDRWVCGGLSTRVDGRSRASCDARVSLVVIGHSKGHRGRALKDPRVRKALASPSP